MCRLCTDLSARTIPQHPRLILTPDKIITLRSKLKTTHKFLWKRVQETAYQFSIKHSSKYTPELKNASNRLRYIGDTMGNLALAYWMTRETKYIRTSEKWINSVLSVPDWKGSHHLGRGSWMMGIALLYDNLYDVLNPDLLQKIRTRLIAEADSVTKLHVRYLSNHYFIETAAIGITGLTLEGNDENAERFLTMADTMISNIIKYAPEDGSWPEGLLYWQYGLANLIKFIEAAKTSGYKDYYPVYDWLKESPYFSIFNSMPTSITEVINWGDSWTDEYFPPFLYYKMASEYNNPHFQFYGDKLVREPMFEDEGFPNKFYWLDFIFYDSNISAKSYTNLPLFKHFKDYDIVTMRSAWDDNATLIGFKCGPIVGHKNRKNPDMMKIPLRPGHCHPDINSFTIFAHGQSLAIDDGYTFLKQTENHNTILVDGYGQAGGDKTWLEFYKFMERKPGPKIIYTQTTDQWDYVIGDAGNIYVDDAKLKHFRRHLLFIKPDIIIIADDLLASKEVAFEWNLNARNPFYKIKQKYYETNSMGVRLNIHPILPENIPYRMLNREIEAHDLIDNQMHSIRFEIKSARKAKYLICLSILKDGSVPAPKVSFSENELVIKYNQKTWTILYNDNPSQPDDPMLTVK
jgi:hypothetical protein